jgi:Domain of unknown function (DUF397)
MNASDLSGAAWRKSSHSGSSEGSCVEVAPLRAQSLIATRDSKNPNGPALCFTPAEWTAFLTTIKHADIS